MAFNLKSRAMMVGMAGILAVSIIGGATVAFAQDGRDGPPAGQERVHRPHRHPVRLGVRAIVANCEIAADDIKAGSETGSTINDILTENGQDPADCKAAVIAKVDERLQQAVDNGRIDEEQKAAALEKTSAGLDRLMAHELGSRRER
jgi:hypothetical protein